MFASVKVFIVLLLLSSCNYKIFVDKNKVIYDESGYLFTMEQGSFFIESRDSTYDLLKIMRSINNKTFWLADLTYDELNAFKNISHKIHIIYTLEKGDGKEYSDTLMYCFVRLRALPYGMELEKPTSSIDISIENKQHNIGITFFNQEVIYIYPLLSEERAEYSKFRNSLYNK